MTDISKHVNDIKMHYTVFTKKEIKEKGEGRVLVGVRGRGWRKEGRCVSLRRRNTGESVSQAVDSQILEMSPLNSGYNLFTLISEN